MNPRIERALQSVRQEWNEAPWFVLLMIGVAALVGPGLVWGAWAAITQVF